MTVELIMALLALGLIVFMARQKKSTTPPELTRDRIKALILGTAKSTVYTTRNGYRVDENEARYTMFKHQYRFGKMFEQASLTPENELKLQNGDRIAPHSREHGLQAGKNADQLRLMVIEKYGIDLETMEDLDIVPPTESPDSGKWS